MLLDLVEQDNSSLRLSAVPDAEVRRRFAFREPSVPAEEMEDLFRNLTG
jgi:hypothetical protein